MTLIVVAANVSERFGVGFERHVLPTRKLRCLRGTVFAFCCGVRGTGMTNILLANHNVPCTWLLCGTLAGSSLVINMAK